jgi:hypothetical protein
MSYSFVSAIGVPKGSNRRWEVVTPGTSSIAMLIQLYRRMIIKVNDGTVDSYVELSTFNSQYSDSALTLQAVIAAQTTLATTPTQPQINIQSAKWVNGVRAGYAMQPWDAVYKDTISPADRADALIKREDPVTDYNTVYKNCLVTINGFYHLTDTDGSSGVLVYGASQSVRLAKAFHFGIHSFQALGGLTIQPIKTADVFKRLTDAMVAGTEPITGYKDIGAIRINTPLNGRAVLLVLGGYLYTPDSGVYRLISDNTLEVDYSRLQLVDRIFESKNYIDLSSLAPALSSTLDYANLPNLLSDVTLLKYLTLSQSFIVILNQTELYTARHYCQKTSVLGEYSSYQKPVYPLQVGLGRVPEYFVSTDGQRWSMQCTATGLRRMVYNSTDPNHLTNITDVSYPEDPELLNPGYQLEIGCDVTV